MCESLVHDLAIDTSLLASWLFESFQAASYITNLVPSTKVAISEQCLWISPKVPIGRPNCVRVFAYSTVPSNTFSPAPNISQDFPTAAISNIVSIVFHALFSFPIKFEDGI